MSSFSIRFSDAFQAAVRRLRTAPEAPPLPFIAPAVPLELPGTSLSQRIRWMIDRIPAGSRVLDLGCGLGEMLYHLARERHVDYLGLEREPEFLERCRNLGLNVLSADFNDLNDPALRYACSQHWDVVLLIDTVNYWRCPAAVLAALNDRARRIFVTIPNAAHIRHRWQLLLGSGAELPNVRGAWKDDRAEFSPDWYSQRWTPAGFVSWANALGYIAHPVARRSVSAKFVPLRILSGLFARGILYELQPRPLT